MRYENTVTAVFRERPNRFIALVDLEGRRETVHVKNTGRCRELLVPGAKVVLAPGRQPGRRTAYDLVAVWKKGLGLVNIDSQAPNRIVGEWLGGAPAPFPGLTMIRPEYAFGSSRLDFYLEAPGRRILLEVKGCTLEVAGQGYFPDAPTARGARHLLELAAAVRKGYECYVAFAITMPKVSHVLPNSQTDPEFQRAFQKARRAGVRFLYLPCRVGRASLSVCGCIED